MFSLWDRIRGKKSVLGICNQFLSLECVTRLHRKHVLGVLFRFCGRYFQLGIENKLYATGKCDSSKWHCILILCVFGFFKFLTSIVFFKLNIFGVYPRSAVQCQARSLILRKCLHIGVDDFIKYLKPPYAFPVYHYFVWHNCVVSYQL